VKLSFAQSFVHAASFSLEVASEPYILQKQRFQKREIDVCRECRVPLIHRECRLISTASDLIRLIILIFGSCKSLSRDEFKELKSNVSSRNVKQVTLFALSSEKWIRINDQTNFVGAHFGSL